MNQLLARTRQWILPLAFGVGITGVFNLLNRPTGEPLALEVPTPVPTSTVAPTATTAPLVIYVSGAVQQPGVYTLPPESRVVDALTAAGGVTEEAALEAVNQASRLSDGMQVHVPEQGTVATPPVLSDSADRPSTEPATASEGPIHLNQADATALEALPGIGPALAARIVEYRAANGPFTSIEQLTEVKGIGDALLERIRPHVVLD